MTRAGFICLSVLISSTESVLAQSAPAASQHVLVYKTRSNYRDKVPVTLSADGRSIISFPAPDDIKTGSAYALPVSLHKGYLLDQRGISPSSAFTGYTYRHYAAFTELPSPEQMLKTITDKKPVTVLYDCGIKNTKTNSVAQLNRLIDHNQLSKKCKVIR